MAARFNNDRAHKLRHKTADRYGWSCHWCGTVVFCPRCTERDLTFAETATMEHLIAKALGGTNSQWNIRLACSRCNFKKGCMNFTSLAYLYVLKRKGYLDVYTEAV